jgi:hypothetical protein
MIWLIDVIFSSDFYWMAHKIANLVFFLFTFTLKHDFVLMMKSDDLCARQQEKKNRENFMCENFINLIDWHTMTTDDLKKWEILFPINLYQFSKNTSFCIHHWSGSKPFASTMNRDYKNVTCILWKIIWMQFKYYVTCIWL